VTGTVKLSEEEVLLILDFESIVEEMGIFTRQEEYLEQMPQTKSLDKRYIVAADDSPVALSMVVKALKKKGFSVLEAKNGKEALEILKKEVAADPERKIGNRVSLLITDVEMPVMDGYTLTKEVRANPELSSLTVLVHSSMSGTENVRKGLEAGANEYLVKFDPVIFVDRIEKLLTIVDPKGKK
jgi:two-component system chemotaxis response regulator CheV